MISVMALRFRWIALVALSMSSACTRSVPDFSGVWGWPADLEEVTPYSREGLPLSDLGQIAHDNFDAQSAPMLACVGGGIPMAPYSPFPFEIVQTEDRILIHYELLNILRVVYMRAEAEFPQEGSVGKGGYSIGHFEDEALVIETRNFSHDQTGLWDPSADDSTIGVPSSDQKVVIERYTLSEDGQTLTLVQHVEDPVYLTEPFETMPQPYSLLPDGEVYYFDCLPSEAGAPLP